MENIATVGHHFPLKKKCWKHELTAPPPPPPNSFTMPHFLEQVKLHVKGPKMGP